MDLITIATFPDLPEAELAKDRLAGEGVASFVLHAGTAGVMPFLSNAEGIQVQVAPADAPRAKEILAIPS